MIGASYSHADMLKFDDLYAPGVPKHTYAGHALTPGKVAIRNIPPTDAALASKESKHAAAESSRCLYAAAKGLFELSVQHERCLGS